MVRHHWVRAILGAAIWLLLGGALPAAAQPVEAAPVVLRGDTLFFVQAPLGDRSPAQRAATIEGQLRAVTTDPGPRGVTVTTIERDGATHLVVGETTVHTVTDLDARAAARTRAQLAAFRAAAIERHLAGPTSPPRGRIVGITLFIVVIAAGAVILAAYLRTRPAGAALPRPPPLRLPPMRWPSPQRVIAYRRRTYEILQAGLPGDRWSRIFDHFLIWLIALNVVALVLETVRPLREAAGGAFLAFEIFSVAVFSVEYLLRLWSAVEDPRFGGDPVRARTRWARTPLGAIDLLAVLPFYLPFLGLDLRALRAFRLFRIARLFKLGRYSTALQSFARVLRAKREELVAVFAILILLLLLSASLLYFAENQAQPEAFASIPAAMWWAIATLTTVGYGDVVPITILGRLAASGIAVLGIGIFALPTGILGAAFVEEMQRTGRARPVEGPTCPHCGSVLEPPPEAPGEEPGPGAG